MNPRAGKARPTSLAGTPLRPLEYFSICKRRLKLAYLLYTKRGEKSSLLRKKLAKNCHISEKSLLVRNERVKAYENLAQSLSKAGAYRSYSPAVSLMIRSRSSGCTLASWAARQREVPPHFSQRWIMTYPFLGCGSARTGRRGPPHSLARSPGLTSTCNDQRQKGQ